MLATPLRGRSQGFLNIALKERDEQTTVEPTNSHHGHIAEGGLASRGSGWRLRLENGLKSLLETGQRVCERWVSRHVRDLASSAKRMKDLLEG